MELLFISNANFHTSAGDITLLVRRAETMQSFGIDTTFINIINQSLGEKYEFGGSVRIINTNPSDRHQDILAYISVNRPAMICLYGNKTMLMLPGILRYINKLSDYNPKVFIDMQGALEEEIDYAQGISKFKALSVYAAKRLVYAYALSRVYGVFTVSDEMYQYCCRISGNSKLYNIKIRCGLTEVLSSQEKMFNRTTVRNKWGVDQDTIVLCFSGYRAPWQNIDRIIDVFRCMEAINNNLFFAFFCNTDDKFERQLRSMFPKRNYVIQLLPKHQYYPHLSACDIGFLIRDDNMTNRVAFPNKFSDYLNSGLLCYISDSMKEPNRILKESKLPFVNESYSLKQLFEVARYRRDQLDTYYHHTEQVCRDFLLFETQYKNQNLHDLIN